MDAAVSDTRRAGAALNDRLLPQEAQALRREVRSVAQDILRPRARVLTTAAERPDGFARDRFDAMAAAGLYAVPFAADVGGRGLEFPTLGTLVVLEELGSSAPGLASALYDGQAIPVGQTRQNAGDRLRNRYLPRLVRGEFAGAFATSEPDASTDLSLGAMQTRAEKVAGGGRIQGRKRWITNAVAADFIAVPCRTEDRQTFLFADMKSAGVCVGRPDLKLGNRAQLTADVTFDGLFVPDDHVIGAVGGGLKAALGALMMGRMGIGALGVAMAAEHMSLRRVFGRPIAAHQHWQFRFADHLTRIAQARRLCHKAAMLHDPTGQAETEADMAKVAGSALAVTVARDAIQARGAMALSRRFRPMPGSGGRSRRSGATARSAKSARAPTRYSAGSSRAAFSAALSRAERHRE